MKQYNINKSLCFLFLGLCFITTQSFAQESFLLKELRIPQVAQENPGAVIPYDGHVSFPGIGRVQVGVNLPFSPFSLSEKVFNKMKQNNVIGFWFQDDPIHFGARNGKKYISLFTAVKVNGNINFQKDLLAFLVEGNDREKNEKLSFVKDDFLSVNAYLEFGVGYNREINENISFGLNVKYLTGLLNAYTNKANISLTTGENYHELLLNSDIQGKFTCVYDVFDEDVGNFRVADALWKNHGFSIDVGGRYKINDMFEISAAVLDIGQIKWKTQSYQYAISGDTFSFKGYVSDNIFEDGNNNFSEKIKDYFMELGDSLLNNFSLETKKISSYTKWLNTRFNVGFSIYASPKDRFNLNFRGIFINDVFVPSGSVSYTRNVGKWFDVVVGNTFKQSSLLNPGLGVNFTLNVFQLYALVDYTNNFIYIDRMKNVNLIFGVNFVAPLGKKFKASYMY